MIRKIQFLFTASVLAYDAESGALPVLDVKLEALFLRTASNNVSGESSVETTDVLDSKTIIIYMVERKPCTYILSDVLFTIMRKKILFLYKRLLKSEKDEVRKVPK